MPSHYLSSPSRVARTDLAAAEPSTAAVAPQEKASTAHSRAEDSVEDLVCADVVGCGGAALFGAMAERIRRGVLFLQEPCLNGSILDFLFFCLFGVSFLFIGQEGVNHGA